MSLRLDLGCWKLEGRGFCPQLERGGSCVVAPSHLILEGHPLALAQKPELTEGEMSPGKRNAQWLGEVGAGWGTPRSPECSVHGQIAQVSRGRQDVGDWSGAS